MSTYRYSGSIRIRITYLDQPIPDGQYRCYLTATGLAPITVYVGARVEHGSGIGVDSPQAFDDVARSAISFADHEASMSPKGDSWCDVASYEADGSAVAISRKAPSGRA